MEQQPHAKRMSLQVHSRCRELDASLTSPNRVDHKASPAVDEDDGEPEFRGIEATTCWLGSEVPSTLFPSSLLELVESADGIGTVLKSSGTSALAEERL